MKMVGKLYLCALQKLFPSSRLLKETSSEVVLSVSKGRYRTFYALVVKASKILTPLFTKYGKLPRIEENSS